MSIITNLVNMSVYNLESRLVSGYTSIRVYNNATSATGMFTEVTTSATRVTLEVDKEYYIFTHTDIDIQGYWYKFKLFKPSGASASSFETTAFRAWSSDLTELLRYDIEDITPPYRYTIKELRRLIKMALWRLQLTAYKNKYYADVDGIIHPQIHNNQDRAVMLLQSLIEVTKSQLTRAADTNILFSDGRGRFNNRTHQALRDNLKDLIIERDKAIAIANRMDVAPVIADIPPSEAST